MTSTKISELPSSGILSGSDLLLAVSASTTVKTTVENLSNSLTQVPSSFYSYTASSAISSSFSENIGVSSFPTAGTLSNSDLFLVESASVNAKVTLDSLRDAVIDNAVTFSCVTVGTIGVYGPTGDWVTFTKTNYGSEVDVIIPGVLEITRANQRGIYNSALEAQYDRDNYTSPINTEWNSSYTDGANYGWNDLSNIDTRIYDVWAEAANNYNPSQSVVNQTEFIMRETTTSRVWQVQFLQWTDGAAGGGFSYKRRELIPGYEICGGIMFGDGTTLSSAANTIPPPDDIYTVVGVGFISNDDSTINLPATFQDWKVRVFRNGTVLDFTDQGSGDSYYTRDTTANTITLSVAASTGEKFVIMAYKKA